MKVIVTGTAGFIGAALAQVLLDRGDEVVGIDCVNNYYDVALKEARLARLTARPGFTEVRIALEDREALNRAFAHHRPARVVNLAAQAGVRYSLENPHAYIDSNLVGFCNVLEACRHHAVEHLVYASSSSVCGASPFFAKPEMGPIRFRERKIGDGFAFGGPRRPASATAPH
jgi:UDP-glucuronate 4-epimerase